MVSHMKNNESKNDMKKNFTILTLFVIYEWEYGLFWLRVLIRKYI